MQQEYTNQWKGQEVHDKIALAKGSNTACVGDSKNDVQQIHHGGGDYCNSIQTSHLISKLTFDRFVLRIAPWQQSFNLGTLAHMTRRQRKGGVLVVMSYFP